MARVIAGMDDFTEDIAGLRRQLDRLPWEIKEALDSGDMETWNELQFRAQSIPHEIERFEFAGLRAQVEEYRQELEAYTEQIDALAPEWQEAKAEYERARARWEEFNHRMQDLTGPRRDVRLSLRGAEKQLLDMQKER